MNKEQKRALIFFALAATALTVAWVYREFLVDSGYRYFRYYSYINYLSIVIICSLGIPLRQNRIIYLFCLERSLNFMLDGLMLIFKFNGSSNLPYVASQTGSILQSFLYLYMFGVMAFRSWKLPALFLLPILAVMVSLFVPEAPSVVALEVAGEYRAMYIGFLVHGSLVLLSYIAYRHVVKNEELGVHAMLILLGWVALFLVSAVSRSSLSPYDIGNFLSYAYIKTIIYAFWILVLYSLWIKGLRHGRMAASTV